jgi:hypothetical protein
MRARVWAAYPLKKEAGPSSLSIDLAQVSMRDLPPL